MGDDDGETECRQRHPISVAHQHHGQEDNAQAHQVPKQDRAHHEPERDAGRDRDETRGENEVHEHERDAVGTPDRSVGSPCETGYCDEDGNHDEAPRQHVACDLRLRGITLEPSHQVIGGGLDHRHVAFPSIR